MRPHPTKKSKAFNWGIFVIAVMVLTTVGLGLASGGAAQAENWTKDCGVLIDGDKLCAIVSTKIDAERILA